MTFSATKAAVKNRGVAPDSFLTELVEWGRTAHEEIFAPNAAVDVYSYVKADLGPWQGAIHRRAVMLEVMRVLGGLESSWNWNEGVDLTNQTSQRHIEGQETGLWQVSYDSRGFGDDLRRLASDHGGQFSITTQQTECFIQEMKSDHPFAMEYIARLLRHTVKANGPVVRREINVWLSRGSVIEFEGLLS